MGIIDTIRKKRLYFDGGMGTMLQDMGLKPGELPETWNLSRADDITSVSRQYIEAGANILTTNTFGANSLKFDNYAELIRAAIKNAARARDEAGKPDIFIGLDIGPSGRMLEPLGDLPFEEAVELFAQQVRAAVDPSNEVRPDMILIETMNDSLETKAAVLAVKENCDLPVFVTNVYDENHTLMTGATPEAMVAMLEGLKVDALGMNCSLGPKQMTEIVPRFAKTASVPIIVNPNAGLPRSENGKTVYDVGPDEFAECMKEIVSAGATLIGGCCGTTPEYIRKEVEATKDIPYSVPEEKDITMVSSFTHAVFIGDGRKTALIGERINPTGKKRFKQALTEHDINFILEEGIRQQKAGADILDVNVGLPEIDEPAMMEEVVSELQAIVDLPLQIDTGDAVAMEKALRIYNGKPMINSVNGKKEIREQVFPLAAKYGGLVVALTIGEDGIPKTSEERFEIAKEIIEDAARYGIKKKDIIIDPLAMTVSADDQSGVVTLETVRRIHDELGGLTSLGLSNISFGLPERSSLNAGFFTMAMTFGLSAAIMNPFSDEMMAAYLSFNALAGRDPMCMDYINGIGSHINNVPHPSGAAKAENAPAEKVSPDENDIALPEGFDAPPEMLPLINAIEKGLKDRARNAAIELIGAGADPIEIVNGAVIPALNIVGEGFEKKTLFLPNLLMAAEASQSAFSVIKEQMVKSETSAEKAGKVVIATVKGDVHDIGKNIVRVILENYGFDVTDLGKDVSPEKVVSAALETGTELVGLSALMTTTVPAMEETIKELHEKAPGVKIMVGGAVMNEDYANMIGADFYGKDAMASVKYAQKVYKREK